MLSKRPPEFTLPLVPLRSPHPAVTAYDLQDRTDERLLASFALEEARELGADRRRSACAS